MLDSALLDRIRPYTLCTPDRLESLASICQSLNANQISGDFVECGTYKGGTAALISTYLESRHLWLYDSFEGMPETTEKDGEAAKEWIGQCRATIDDVKAVIQCVETRAEQYTVRPGWFETTFQQPLPEKIALLHCDCDWYNSVSLALETFYPRLVEGGCVVLDDFGFWEGCREAFYDFCQQHGEKPLLERVGIDQAYWFKGQKHNRHTIATDAAAELVALRAELTQTQQTVLELKSQLEAVVATNQLMQSGRWQLRSLWHKVKQRLERLDHD